MIDGGIFRLSDADGQVVLEAHGEALLSDGTVLTTTRPTDGLEWRVDASHSDGASVRLRLRTDERASAGVEQLRPIVAPHGYRGLPLSNLHIHQTGWQSWSRAHPAAPFESNFMTAAPPIRGPW